MDENRKTVTNEIKKAICNLIMEINRKGKILINQLEVIVEYLLKQFFIMPSFIIYSVCVCERDVHMITMNKNAHLY